MPVNTKDDPERARRFREAAWEEILRLIKEEDPPTPSARLSDSGSLPTVAAQRQLEPVRLTKLVRGELDWIVMKCLEKNRTRRYETANGLSRDLQRYLRACVDALNDAIDEIGTVKSANKDRGIL